MLPTYVKIKHLQEFPYIAQTEKRLLMNAYSMSQFDNYPLV